ncbi:MAG TPA: YhfC family glutamic-type intramembrane protease [Anaerolineales bacterium]
MTCWPRRWPWGLSILVLQSIRRQNARWLVLAIGWHALVNTAALLALAAWGAWATEGVIALFALASLGAVFRLRDHSEATAEEVAGRTAAADPAARPSAADPTWMERPERLEDSRYLEE